MTATARQDRVLTLEEWRAEAVERFGPSFRDWRFVCPRCGGVQSIADFEALGDKLGDAKPANVVFYSCLGRWTGAPGWDGKSAPTPETRCNWTLGGLFRIHSTEVIAENGDRVPVMEFADSTAARSRATAQEN